MLEIFEQSQQFVQGKHVAMSSFLTHISNCYIKQHGKLEPQQPEEEPLPPFSLQFCLQNQTANHLDILLFSSIYLFVHSFISKLPFIDFRSLLVQNNQLWRNANGSLP